MKYSLFVHKYYFESNTNEFIMLMQSDDLGALGKVLKDFNAAYGHDPHVDVCFCCFFIARDGDYHKRVWQYEIDEAIEEDNV